jgi:serine/threonine protein phosphatase PrpC
MKYYGITDKGLVRKNNQDSYVIATDVAGDIFAIVADGIGGNLGGDVASRMTVAHFSKAFSEMEGFASEEEAKKWIREHISYTNSLIYHYGEEHRAVKGLGTTFCGVMITTVGTFVVNIGDSRCYAWYEDGRFRQLTTDHSLVNDMVMHGELTPEEARDYPKKNVLTNALGVWESVKCDIDVHNEPMEGMMLCSDGLHGYVSEEHIKEVLMSNEVDPSLRARRLMQSALDAGGYDNVTVILIDLEGRGQA